MRGTFHAHPSFQAETQRFQSKNWELVASASAALDSHRLREMRGDVNVGKALPLAADSLETDPQEPPERIAEEDWLLRWRNSASQVSAKELQELWGRVPAGEIKSPGTFSLRTLELLGTLSRDEARQISKLAPFVFDNDFVFIGDNSLLEAEGITFDFRLGLQGLGVIDVTELKREKQCVTGTAASGKYRTAFAVHDRILIVTHSDPQHPLTLPVCRLTSLGTEVMTLGAFSANEGYVRQIGRATRDQGFATQLAKCQQISETEWKHGEPEDL